MDLATLIGLIFGFVIVIGAILIESSIMDFVNVPGLVIVVVGTIAITLVKYRLTSVATSFKLAFSTVFLERTENPVMLIEKVRELSGIVRKEGILGLENAEIEDEFLAKGIALCIDGHPSEFIEELLIQELEQSIERYDTAEKVFRGVAETAPGLGMLGTLVGLVQMLNNMADPSSVGPAMAVALLTTFYGAFIAQVVAIPLADKLNLKAMDEHRNMSLVITSVQNILKGQNPRVITEVLVSYLPPAQREIVKAEG
ncbi:MULTISPECIES: MotA/TolQ/ExbB proton channel family protein [unclassified Oleiphilus]|uniref:MotA/TolQ/ExbB proton channel family protein n=1 Tax=unclassified Oleiphilus TaxID=2631174 RepID=UPI0007C23534|nr:MULTISPECIES: MotA/TolQ/ExbB proton channel family protein [unclassified Oleiphilus]KZY30643.1 flagellar motor protein PomA [Oleiphilus sp. HI0043]KZZ35305.1 flagellar motor protein PomA [Oleiphilus sp. HI0086]KZZ38303.1 flagellar motor protein PomA [Oleiphilus sp. HI0117]KZZ55479.1 flagellar motor protein PomA [Oleiphilus sp. HI0123]KZZ64966.1 flagellar motor protein PomA [Oleiphilus sp. HI0128]